MLEDVLFVDVLQLASIRSKTNRLVTQAFLDNIFNSIKGPTNNEQNIAGINLNKLLLRMFTATLRRNVGNRAFQNLKQCLLNPFAGNVTSNRDVFAFLAILSISSM